MGGGARNHGGTRGHGCLPLPGEMANYNLHTLSDKKLFKIINCSEKVKEKQPANQKLMLVKGLPQIKNGVAFEQAPKKVVEGQTHKKEHKYKKTPSTKVTNDPRSQHNKTSKVDKKKTGVSNLKPALSGGGSAETSNDATATPAKPVKKLKVEEAVQSRLDEAVEKLPLQKSEYKSVIGSDRMPGVLPVTAADEPDHAEDSAESIHGVASAQDDLDGMLESDKAGHTEIDKAVKKLLPQKAEHKSVKGSDCRHGVVYGPAAVEPVHAEASDEPSAEAINAADTVQGEEKKLVKEKTGVVSAVTAAPADPVKKLNVEKAMQSRLDKTVKKLSPQKSEYKSVRGSDWKPGVLPATVADEPDHVEASAESIQDVASAQLDLDWMLESDKTGQTDIDEAVKKLHPQKADNKSVKGSECTVHGEEKKLVKEKTGVASAVTAALAEPVMNVKVEKAVQSGLDGAVEKLPSKKCEYESVRGSGWKPGGLPATASDEPDHAADSAESIQGIASAQEDLDGVLESDRAGQTEIDEAVKKLLPQNAEYKAVTESECKPGVVPVPTAVEPVHAEDSAEVINAANTVQGEVKKMVKDKDIVTSTAADASADQVKKLKVEQAVQSGHAEAVEKVLPQKSEYKSVRRSELLPATAADRPAHAEDSAEAIIAANNVQGEVKGLVKEKAGVLAAELHMQQFCSYQESVGSFQLPVYLILPHPHYGYSFAPVFWDSTLIFMEDQVSMQQSSEDFKTHDHPQD